MMDWLISLVPWWAWLIASVAAVVAVWRLLGWHGAVMAAAGLLAVLGYGKGRADASRDARVSIDRRNTQAMKDRKDIDDDVDQMGSNDIDSNFARWMRGDDAR